MGNICEKIRAINQKLKGFNLLQYPDNWIDIETVEANLNKIKKERLEGDNYTGF